jgi:diguanylate cyclase (GGDEF)-like protein/PAS domain S-box-containing protein
MDPMDPMTGPTPRDVALPTPDGTLALLQQAVDCAPTGIAVVDADGVFRSVNPAYCELYRYRADELIGQAFTVLFPPAQRARVLALHHGFMAGGTGLDGEWDVLRHDGAWLRVAARTVRVPAPDGGLQRLVYVVDITQRRRAELALQASQRFNRAVIDGLAAHVCVVDDSGTIVLVNRAWRSFAAANGGTPARLHEGANYLAVCEAAVRAAGPGEAEAATMLGLLREVLGGQRQQFQLEYPCHSPGAQRWFIARVSRLADSDPPCCVISHDNVSALKQAEEALRSQAATDELTGLANRRSFMAALAAEFQRLQRHPGRLCSVLALDLDHFKRVNDRWGHAAGDAVLRHFAQVVAGLTRAGDVLGRIGGEEFAVLLPDTGPDDAQALGERLRLQVAQATLPFNGQVLGVTVSIGVAVLDAGDAGAEAALQRADQALYRAKGGGRNRVRRWVAVR